MFPKNGYLIHDYTDAKAGENCKLYEIHTSSEFFKLMEDVKDGKKSVAIFEIGDCVADWS